jgi:predicted transcriptional regulator
MIWNKVGFILASKQRIEVFRLAIENQTIEEIENKVKETKNVRRILKDFEKEGLIKIKKDKIKLTKTGRKILKLLEKGFRGFSTFKRFNNF